jgi:hypothetical protein
MSLPPYDQSVRDFERHYQVVLPDSVGQATVGFRDGVWFRLNSGTPHPVPIRSAIILCPHAAGSIVQIACWWMRENSRMPRALDLATELALTVGELPSVSAQTSSAALGGASMGSASMGGSPLGGSPYDSGSYGTDPYPAAPAPAPSPYEPAYAAATTMIPQITPEMTAPGRSFGAAGRPPAPMPALPPSGAGRPPAGQGYAAGPRGPVGGQGPMPGPRPPMGQPGAGQSGNWDRSGPGSGSFDPRTGRPAGGPPPRQPGYESADPRDDFFRGGPPPQQRRPERDEYNGGRPPQGRPAQGRQDPGRAW